MESKYTYIPSNEFINKLDFEYVEAYSFQRRTDNDTQSMLSFEEYKELKIKQKSSEGLSELEAQNISETEKFNGHNNYILDADGKLHETAVKTRTFKKSHLLGKMLRLVMNTPIKNVPSWVCSPVYRDAIVFYDSEDKILASLNVCLSCEHMAAEKLTLINADKKTYEAMKGFFINLGHAIEEQ